jgi:hypothetical protein
MLAVPLRWSRVGVCIGRGVAAGQRSGEPPGCLLLGSLLAVVTPPLVPADVGRRCATTRPPTLTRSKHLSACLTVSLSLDPPARGAGRGESISISTAEPQGRLPDAPNLTRLQSFGASKCSLPGGHLAAPRARCHGAPHVGLATRRHAHERARRREAASRGLYSSSTTGRASPCRPRAALSPCLATDDGTRRDLQTDTYERHQGAYKAPQGASYLPTGQPASRCPLHRHGTLFSSSNPGNICGS